MSAQFKRKRELTSQQLDVLNKLERWADRGSILEFVILRNPKDGYSAIIDFGCWQAACDLRWLPQLNGMLRKLKFLRTGRRRIYAYPAELDALEAGEFDDARQMFFTASLRQWPDGRYHFKLDSGVILLPIDQEVWQKADKKDDGNYGKILGRRIELTGWARNTVYMVAPLYPDNVTYTQKLEARSTIDRQAAEIAIRHQRQFGLVPVNIAGEIVPILASTLLGIGIHEPLNKSLITKRYKAAVLQAGKVGGTLHVTSKTIESGEAVRAAQEAREILEELVDHKVKQMADLFPRADGLPDNGNGEETETIEIECTDCQDLPHGTMTVPLRDIIEGKVTSCPKCKATVRLIDGTTLIDTPGARDLLDLDDKQVQHILTVADTIGDLAAIKPESIRLPHVITPLKAADIAKKTKEAVE